MSFQNTSSTTLTDFKLSYKIDGVKGLWLPKSLVKVQNGAWKPADPAPGTHDSVPLGSFQVKANEMITVVIRLSPEGTMPTLYNLSLTGASEVLPYGVGPENVKYTCNRLTGSFAADVRVRRPGGATGTPTATAEPSATGTPTESASPTATATTAAPSTTTSTGPRTTGTTGTGTTGSTGTTGTRLAETGASSSTLPLAITGGVAIALGAASVLVARRRKAARD
ncbi:LPXTG cell wall anchor domain-containing protein [Kitasatospora sp. NPDC093806]|uniref:LPXTG cell wall anchor domain-containing protein n=1 Tax=Kitasatospora sp. NPDC093806 TaxID=3155075 RepID=UPI00341F29ED